MTAQTVLRDGKALVRFNWSPDTASGRRQGWGKIITGINRGQRGGYAIDGAFLKEGAQEMEAGTLILDMTPSGSVKNPEKLYSIAWIDPSSENGYNWILRHQREVTPALLDVVEMELSRYAERQAAVVAAISPKPVESKQTRISDILDFKTIPDDQLRELIERATQELADREAVEA